MCALFAGTASIGAFDLSGAAAAFQAKDAVGVFALILSGWVNPLVLFFLLFCIWKRFVIVRRALAIAILVCIGASWAFIARTSMSPKIGHFVWIAGILVMLSPEAVAIFAKKPDAASETSQASA